MIAQVCVPRVRPCTAPSTSTRVYSETFNRHRHRRRSVLISRRSSECRSAKFQVVQSRSGPIVHQHTTFRFHQMAERSEGHGSQKLGWAITRRRSNTRDSGSQHEFPITQVAVMRGRVGRSLFLLSQCLHLARNCRLQIQYFPEAAHRSNVCVFIFLVRPSTTMQHVSIDLTAFSNDVF